MLVVAPCAHACHMLCHTRCTYPEAKQVVALMDSAQCMGGPRAHMPATCCNVHVHVTCAEQAWSLSITLPGYHPYRRGAASRASRSRTL